MKKITKILLIVTIMSILLTNCFAMTNSKLLEYFKNTHVVAGQRISLNQTQLTKIENFLNKNKISSENADIIIAKAEEVKRYMTSVGVSNPMKLNAYQKQKVMTLVEEAGSAAGVKVYFNKTTNEMTISQNGKVLENISFTNKIPFTGTNVMPYAYLAFGIISLITLITIALKSKRLSNAF